MVYVIYILQCLRLDWAGPWQSYPGQTEVLGEGETERESGEWEEDEKEKTKFFG